LGTGKRAMETVRKNKRTHPKRGLGSAEGIGWLTMGEEVLGGNINK